MLRIGGAVLDLDRGTLRRDGEIVPVRPKTLELLAVLTRNPGRVLSKDEMVWLTKWHLQISLGNSH
jgi:DNA-binding winged helix-turn-helix (wHTH) protein